MDVYVPMYAYYDRAKILTEADATGGKFTCALPKVVCMLWWATSDTDKFLITSTIYGRAMGPKTTPVEYFLDENYKVELNPTSHATDATNDVLSAKMMKTKIEADD